MTSTLSLPNVSDITSNVNGFSLSLRGSLRAGTLQSSRHASVPLAEQSILKGELCPGAQAETNPELVWGVKWPGCHLDFLYVRHSPKSMKYPTFSLRCVLSAM